MVVTEFATETVDDKDETTPLQVVSFVLDDIEEAYGFKKRGKLRSQRDSLRLATARVLQFHSDNSPYPSEHEKSALEAVNGALLGDWEPVRAFIQIEVKAAKGLREINYGELADYKPPIENLLASI